MTDTLLRVSPAVQRGFAAWVINGRCAAIVGFDDQDNPRARAPLRRPMIAFAAHLDPRYPRDGALAATDMMLAVALRHPSAAVRRARGDGARRRGHRPLKRPRPRCTTPRTATPPSPAPGPTAGGSATASPRCESCRSRSSAVDLLPAPGISLNPSPAKGSTIAV